MMDFKPSASAFSLPLPPSQQPQSVRIARYEPRKRRKHSEDWDEDTSDVGGEMTDAVSDSGVTLSGTDLILSPEEAHQYRIAGLPFDQKLPSGNFPHGAPRDWTRSSRQTQNHIIAQLPSLSPPLYPPQSAAYQGNLRLQHLAVITSILHRCLLQGDYVRAGRAWGILLREEFGGKPIDVRNEGRWGIGAEILLRRGHRISRNTPGSGSLGNLHHGMADASGLCFTRAGFEDAKRYYERLIIQHPFRKAAPDAISSLHFYPAMFGLWIYVVQEECNAARKDIQCRLGESEWFSEDEETGSEFEDQHGERPRRRGLLAEVDDKERDQAQQIAARMDEILSSPPYSDSQELLELRAMVSLWVSDLLVSSLPQEELDRPNADYDYHHRDDDDNDLTVRKGFPGLTHARREQRLAMERREAELQKSRRFFERARQRGRSMTSTLENFRIDDSNSPNPSL